MKQTINCKVYFNEIPPVFVDGKLLRVEPGKYKLKMNSVVIPKTAQHATQMDIQVEFNTQKDDEFFEDFYE
jgi:hypothetical protein